MRCRLSFCLRWFSFSLLLLAPFSYPLRSRVWGATDGKALLDLLNAEVRKLWSGGYEDFLPQRTEVTAVEIGDDAIVIRFSDALAGMPMREETPARLETLLRGMLGEEHGEKPLRLFVGGRPLGSLILRESRRSEGAVPPGPHSVPLLRQADTPAPPPMAGLFGRHLVVSSSHGWMYDVEKSLRWEWQRPRLFTTVEDLHTLSYVVPFLIPMLERAGAVIFSVKERDWQTNEVVLDDADGEDGRFAAGGVKMTRTWKNTNLPGFASGLQPYPDGFNPHRAGTVRVAETRPRATAKIEWVPDIPETGEYGVSISYHAAADRPSDARYTVFHTGGGTTFLVNQKMAGNTWVWLGRFHFEEGTRPSRGRVELTNASDEPGTVVCADAVRFGGGMGSVVRGGRASGYPRYTEGARYSLQYAGAPPELTYKTGFTTGYEGPDYSDDFTCRPEWANYLHGAPAGPNKDPDNAGLGVPIDMYFSLHTDAGISQGIIGTLAIYRTVDQRDQEVFPDGRSRLLNRDLADMVQSQIVGDVRALYTSTWTRRRLMDGNYAEIRRANVPSCLIEFLSHQNFNDLQYGLDPCFRRDVARAMYKGILRFLAREHGYEAVVQPLPPTHLTAVQREPGSVEIAWRPQTDPLEASAEPSGYIVYRRVGDGGFDNGTYTGETRLTVGGPAAGEVVSFRAEAVNEGGRSLPSETLAVGSADPQGRRALIVSAFDRLGAPSSVSVPGYQGFDRVDRGVGYLFNFGQCGGQYDFDPQSEFVTNDRPGHGASAGDLEDRLELGNTFDYVARHGRAFADCGWGFDSASDEAVAEGMIELADYALVDWLLGEQRTEWLPSGFVEAGTPDRMQPMFRTFPAPVQTKLREHVRAGGALFVSGAYVASDLADGPLDATADLEFLHGVLRVERVTNQGSNTNQLLPQKGELFDGLAGLRFARGLGEDGVYGVELPDAIDPAKDSGARTVLRYADRRFSAGVVHESSETHSRTLVLGFPFEAIIGSERRAEFLKRALSYLHPEM